MGGDSVRPVLIPTAILFYDVVLFLHVAAVIVGLGATFAFPFFQGIAERTAPQSVPAVLRAMQVIDRFLVTPALFVILGAGIYLVLDGPFDWEDTFVNVGLVGIVVLIVLGPAFFTRHEHKLLELAERDVAAAGSGEVQLSEEYMAYSKRYALVGSLAGVLILVIAFFMITKPFL
jgi:uncharacterized membrane protein